MRFFLQKLPTANSLETLFCVHDDMRKIASIVYSNGFVQLRTEFTKQSKILVLSDFGKDQIREIEWQKAFEYLNPKKFLKAIETCEQIGEYFDSVRYQKPQSNEA